MKKKAFGKCSEGFLNLNEINLTTILFYKLKLVQPAYHVSVASFTAPL